MKKIILEVSQTGSEDFIAQSEIKIRIGSKLVKNTVADIVLSAIHLTFGCRITIFDNSVYIITLNGKRKRFSLSSMSSIAFDTNEMNKDDLQKRMKKIVSFIKNIEAWMYDTHKKTTNYTISSEDI